jgi:hypothetical protein
MPLDVTTLTNSRRDTAIEKCLAAVPSRGMREVARS